MASGKLIRQFRELCAPLRRAPIAFRISPLGVVFSAALTATAVVLTGAPLIAGATCAETGFRAVSAGTFANAVITTNTNSLASYMSPPQTNLDQQQPASEIFQSLDSFDYSVPFTRAEARTYLKQRWLNSAWNTRSLLSEALTRDALVQMLNFLQSEGLVPGSDLTPSITPTISPSVRADQRRTAYDSTRPLLEITGANPEPIRLKSILIETIQYVLNDQGLSRDFSSASLQTQLLPPGRTVSDVLYEIASTFGHLVSIKYYPTLEYKPFQRQSMRPDFGLTQVDFHTPLVARGLDHLDLLILNSNGYFPIGVIFTETEWWDGNRKTAKLFPDHDRIHVRDQIAALAEGFRDSGLTPNEFLNLELKLTRELLIEALAQPTALRRAIALTSLFVLKHDYNRLFVEHLVEQTRLPIEGGSYFTYERFINHLKFLAPLKGFGRLTPQLVTRFEYDAVRSALLNRRREVLASMTWIQN